jgi:hypothetical protein
MRIAILVALVLLATCGSVTAAPIASDIFLEFSFREAGVQARGCDPADPAGDFCIPSSGATPTDFAPAPPWQFTADTGGATLTVTDAFFSGDRFELFDFGVSIGLTSSPSPDVDCGDDPAVCLVTPGMSTGTFALAAGSHSITLTPTLSPEDGGAGYLSVTGATSAVPEPSTLLLLLAAGAGLLARVARSRSI